MKTGGHATKIGLAFLTYHIKMVGHYFSINPYFQGTQNDSAMPPSSVHLTLCIPAKPCFSATITIRCRCSRNCRIVTATASKSIMSLVSRVRSLSISRANNCTLYPGDDGGGCRRCHCAGHFSLRFPVIFTIASLSSQPPGLRLPE